MSLVHLHLIVNHLPVMATALALMLLVLAAVRPGDRGVWTSGALLLVVAAAGALVTLETGEAAEEAIEGLPGVLPALIEAHEERATWGIVSSLVAGAVAAVGWWWGRRRPAAAVRKVVWATLVVAAASTATLAWVGTSGGVIRHPEIRDSPPASEARAR